MNLPKTHCPAIRHAGAASPPLALGYGVHTDPVNRDPRTARRMSSAMVTRELDACMSWFVQRCQ